MDRRPEGAPTPVVPTGLVNMYRNPLQVAKQIENAIRRLRWTPQSGDVLIVRVGENSVDVKMLDDREFEALCNERWRL